MTTKIYVFLLALVCCYANGFVYADNLESDIFPKGLSLHEKGSIFNKGPLVKPGFTLTVIYADDFESGGGAWAANGSWAIGSPSTGPNGGYSSSNCAGTGLHGNYPDNADDLLISPTIILPLLSGTDELLLNFWEWYQIESGYDHGFVMISSDAGNSWNALSTRSGTNSWRNRQINISYYEGESINLGFRFSSDDSVSFSGWFIDDVQIVEESPPPLSAWMTSPDPANFPFIYTNVSVDTFGVGFPDLDSSNFTIYEDGIEQTDYVNIVPPDTGGGGIRRADIVFLMDNSGSMDPYQNAVRDNVYTFVDSLVSGGVDFGLGLTRFGQSSSGGYPFLEDNGNPTSNATYFRDDVWMRNVIIGGTERGYDALGESAIGFNFRTGAQRIFILITDEDADPGNWIYSQALQALLDNSITLHVLINSASGSSYLYCDMALATGGACFNVTDPFEVVFDSIGGGILNSYAVGYRTNQTELDGRERFVEIQIDDNSNSATCEGSYIPGMVPNIRRTDSTIALHDQSWAEYTQFTMAAYITDRVAPFVQNAELHYKTTTSSTYQSVSMTNISDSTYEAQIPTGIVLNPGIDYYISASDGQHSSTDPSEDPLLFPYQLAILPNVAPSIIHTPVTGLTPGVAITITAEISDSTNSLQYASLFYRRIGELTFQEANMVNTYDISFEADIPSIYVTSGGVEYYLFAIDDLGIGSYHGLPSTPHQITGCGYIVGDVNGSNSYNGLDITYGVAYFKGGPEPQCPSGSCHVPPCDTFFYCGDVNGSCTYNGLDIVFGVLYLKGERAELIPCPDCAPVN